MKKKTFFLLASLLSSLVVVLAVVLVIRGISAEQKRQEHFDVYRAKAEAYIRSDSDIFSRFGDNLYINFVGSVTYSDGEEDEFFDRLLEFINPQVPDTVTEFTKDIEMIKFDVEINAATYEIVFERDEYGTLDVSRLTFISQ